MSNGAISKFSTTDVNSDSWKKHMIKTGGNFGPVAKIIVMHCTIHDANPSLFAGIEMFDKKG